MYKSNLKKLKDFLHLNTLELSEKLGISYSTLGSYERGKRTPSIDFLLLLADKLKVNPNWILMGTGELFLNSEKNTLKKREVNDIVNTVNIGQRLSDIQEKNSLSDKEMAKILGIFEEDYIEFKNGNIEPTLKIINRIKQAFEVSVDWLLYCD